MTQRTSRSATWAPATADKVLTVPEMPAFKRMLHLHGFEDEERRRRP